MTGTLHVFSAGEQPTADNLNANFEILISAGASVQDPVSSATEITSSATSAARALEDQLAVVTNGGIIESSQLAVVSAGDINASHSSAISSAAAEIDAMSAVISGGQMSTSATSAGIVTATDALNSAVASAGDIISASSAIEPVISAISASVPILDSSGYIQISELPYTAGVSVSISSEGIITDTSYTGTMPSGEPDVYCYFGGRTDATTGEYAFGIRASKGIASISHDEIGQFTLNFTAPFPDANYIALFSGGYGGDASGATAGDTTTWDTTTVLISEHRGGEYASRTPSSLIIETMYITPSGGRSAQDIARISVAIWAAPTGATITTSGTVSTAT